MKLAYITNVKVPAGDAQSLQISAMAKSFFVVLKDDFLLISPMSLQNRAIDSKYRWHKLHIFNKPRWLRYLMTLLFSIKTVINFSPEVVYSRDILVVAFYKLLGYQAVYEIHKPFETILGNLVFKTISQNIKIVAISQALKDFLLENYNLGESKILVAHDGAFVEDFLAISRNKSRSDLVDELSLADRSFVAMYIGNTKVGGKGINLIIQAANTLKDIKFVIIGGSKSSLGDVPNNMYFINRKAVAEIPRYLKSADVLLLPFTKELKTYKYHSALKMFEYMASGTPIVASDLGTIKEVLNINNSFLFNCEDYLDLASKISAVKGDVLKANLRAEQALKDVKKYDWSRRAELILNFLFT